jgi:hypothetical protein
MNNNLVEGDAARSTLEAVFVQEILREYREGPQSARRL